MRRRKLKKLWKRLKELQAMKTQKRDALLLKLGAAKQEAGKAWDLVDVVLPNPAKIQLPRPSPFTSTGRNCVRLGAEKEPIYCAPT